MTLLVMNGNVYYELCEGVCVYIGQKADVDALSAEDVVRLVHIQIAHAKGIHLSDEPRLRM